MSVTYDVNNRDYWSFSTNLTPRIPEGTYLTLKDDIGPTQLRNIEQGIRSQIYIATDSENRAKDQKNVPPEFRLSLASSMTEKQIQEFGDRFRTMPRQIFDAMMKGYLNDPVNFPPINGRAVTGEEKSWVLAMFLELFNKVNAEELNRRQIVDPWEWEAQKMDVYYRTQAESDLMLSNPALFINKQNSADNLKLIIVKGLEERAAKIGDKIDDNIYKLQFLAAVKLMLEQEAFDEVGQALTVYENIPDSDWEKMRETVFKKDSAKEATNATVNG